MTEPPKSRSLNFTLEELLGLTLKENGGESVRTESSGRPPTRHGRESLSQAPESSSTSTRRSSEQNGDFSLREIEQKENGADEEFLNKLNSLRRRSLVSTKLPAEGDHRQIPLRTPIEESQEFPELSLDFRNSHQTTIKASRPSTSESTHTFKVEEEEKTTPKAETNGKSVKMNGAAEKAEKATKDTPKRFTSSLTGPPNPGSAHERWLRQKIEAERERKIKEKEKAEKKKIEDIERKKEAKKLFEKWKNHFEEKLKARRQSEKEKRQLEKQEKEEQMKDADKTYQAWKRDKLEKEKQEVIENGKKKEKLQVREKQKDEERALKHKEAQSAFEAWCREKREQEENAEVKQREEKDLNSRRKEAENEYKKALADEAYATWLQLKEEEFVFEKTSLAEGMLIRSASSIPWVPPSNTVPRTFTPTNRPRRRSLDAPRRSIPSHRAPFSTRFGLHPIPPPTQTSTKSTTRRAQSAKNFRIIRSFLV
ncbi:unnamed protein product, partial [Mesorhabditis belari]|uniref:Microtubule-associated protein 9 n=1 Tax=Mesorhabditis belari TaxID=2138241 RepID=A0AAF3EAX9_9BILA